MKSFSLFNLWRVDRVCIITIQTVKHSPQTYRIWTKRFNGGYPKDRISLHYYAVKHKIKILFILKQPIHMLNYSVRWKIRHAGTTLKASKNSALQPTTVENCWIYFRQKGLNIFHNWGWYLRIFENAVFIRKFLKLPWDMMNWNRDRKG